MRVNWERLTVILGFAGAAMVALTCVASALAYIGKAGQRYSPLNHFVSELGEVGVSPLADAFNAGLIVGGACIAASLVGVARTLRGRSRYVFGVVGLTAGLSGTLVGAFPMNNFNPHALAALTFFSTGWIAVAVFSLYAYLWGEDIYPRWLALIGLPCIAAFIAFLALSKNVPLDALANPDRHRPDVWPLTIFEWIVIALVLVWIAAVAWQLRRRAVRA